MKKTFLNWSSGKDAALALYLLQQQKKYSVEKLVTTIDSQTSRISIHGLRKELLVKQAQSLKIPLHIISFSGNVPLGNYNIKMEQEMEILRAEGFGVSVFGDIFLEDLKEYRERQLQKVGLEAVFPLWKRNTSELMGFFIDSGFRAITVSINANLLDKSFCGRVIDRQFLKDLPEGVDPCGENGEFHTFVFDGPIFRRPISFQKGENSEVIFSSQEKEDDEKSSEQKWSTRFWNCDLLP